MAATHKMYTRILSIEHIIRVIRLTVSGSWGVISLLSVADMRQVDPACPTKYIQTPLVLKEAHQAPPYTLTSWH